MLDWLSLSPAHSNIAGSVYAMQALPLFLDRLADPISAVILSVTVVLLFGAWPFWLPVLATAASQPCIVLDGLVSTPALRPVVTVSLLSPLSKNPTNVLSSLLQMHKLLSSISTCALQATPWHTQYKPVKKTLQQLLCRLVLFVPFVLHMCSKAWSKHTAALLCHVLRSP